MINVILRKASVPQYRFLFQIKSKLSLIIFQNFSTLQSTYRTSLCKLYDKDIRRFFENAKFKISGHKLTQTGGSSQVILFVVVYRIPGKGKGLLRFEMKFGES